MHGNLLMPPQIRTFLFTFSKKHYCLHYQNNTYSVLVYYSYHSPHIARVHRAVNPGNVKGNLNGNLEEIRFAIAFVRAAMECAPFLHLSWPVGN